MTDRFVLRNRPGRYGPKLFRRSRHGAPDRGEDGII
jgi:hypothetical protein